MNRACGMTRWLAFPVILFGLLGSTPSVAADVAALAIADFDYVDSSGEPQDQSQAHAQRLRDFVLLVRDGLSASGKYRIVEISCPQSPCSAGAMDANSLTDAARKSGARLLLYGGIHKMSTLVQFGKAEVFDLQTDKVVYDRMITFRGDNDEAWKRAAKFLAEDLSSKELQLAP
jgi:uncharacterized protein DUF2380